MDGCSNRCASSPGAGTRLRPFPGPARPSSFAPVYGNLEVYGAARSLNDPGRTQPFASIARRLKPAPANVGKAMAGTARKSAERVKERMLKEAWMRMKAYSKFQGHLY